MDSRSLSIRAPVSEDVEDSDAEEIGDEELQGEDDGGSFVSDESYDSALDAITLASNADAPSSTGSVNEYASEGLRIEDVGAPQQGALRQLNELNSGVSSLDTTLLDNSSEEEFRKRVLEIAESKNLSSDDEVIGSIVDALLPIVRGRVTRSGFVGDNPLGYPDSRAMPVAKPTVEDDDDSEDDVFEEQRGIESHSDSDRAEEDLEGDGAQPDSARGFRVRGVDSRNGELESAGGLRVRGGHHDFEESEDDVVDNEGQLVMQPEPREEAAVVPANGDQSDGNKSGSVVDESKTESNGNAVREVDEGALSDKELDENEATRSADVTSQPQEIENLEQVTDRGLNAASLNRETLHDADQTKDSQPPGSLQFPQETRNSDPVVEDTAPVKPKEGEEPSDPVGEHTAKEAEEPSDSLDEHSVPEKSKEGDEASDPVVEDSAPVKSKEDEELSTQVEPIMVKDTAAVKPEEVEEPSSQVQPSVVEDAAPVKSKEGEEFSTQAEPTLVKDTAAVKPKEGEEPSTEVEPSVGEDAALMKSKEGEEPSTEVEPTGVVDAALGKSNEGEEPSTQAEPTVVEDTAPVKSKEVEEPATQRELTAEDDVAPEKSKEVYKPSTQEEPVVANKEENITETSEVTPDEGTPDVEEESKLAPKEERSAKEDVVVSKQGLKDESEDDDDTREEELAENDVTREEELAENAARLAAFVSSKASTAPSTDTPSLGGAGPSLPVRPAGLGRSVPSLEHAPRAAQRSIGGSPPSASRVRDNNPSNSDASEDGREAREKLQMIRVKFLRLAHRLGQSAHNVVVAQVLYRLGLAEQLRGGRGISTAGAFSFERASLLAEEQEAAGQDELEFGCTIMVLGKSGVGKSATINSLFDEVKSGTDAYSPATKSVRVITGTIHGIKLTVIDTPGLLPSFADQRHNEKVMRSVKHLIKKSPPDIVLYFDRLDMQSRDYGDLPLLRTITDTFGAAVWFNAIVVLTHASSAPPDGANGVPLSYEMFVAQRSHVVQQTIRQAAGDMRLMNPVSLVENHAACRTNRAGQRVLPNGQVWKPQLLLLCFSSKILAEANSLLKLQDSSQGKPFGVRPRVPPLPFLLSSLLQSRAQLRHPDDLLGDDDLYDDSSEEEADSDGEEEYDDLPPFRRLTKEELLLLDDEQRKIYFDELDYREKLFMKQQWKEEQIRRRQMRKRKAGASGEISAPYDEGFEEESAGSAAVPVPMPDMALPPSFDSDCPSHRYRYLDTATQWLVRPVLETHGWDHDSGYDGLNIEKVFVISKKIPASVSGQITKDKKEANLQMECAASFKSGETKATLAGLDVQTIGKDLAYTLRSETRFSNFKRNKTTCGLAVTILGDTVAAGMKLEDALMVGRRFKLVLNGGAITGRGDVAYGGSLEATLRDKDYPIVHTLSTLGLSIMDWHGDLAIGGNVQSQLMLGKTMMIARANLNNRGAGQISIRASSAEQLQMALIGLIPLLRSVLGNRIFNSSG